MGKGLVSGIIWGVIVSGLVLVLLALTTPVPQRGGTGLARPAEAPANALPSGAQTPDADDVAQGAPATGETPAGETDEAAPSREQGAPAAVPEQAQDGPLQEPVMENTAAGRGVAPTAPTTSVPEAPPVADPAADAPVAAPATSPAVDIVLPEGSAFGRPEGLERNDLPGEAPAPRAAPGAAIPAPPLPAADTPALDETAPASAPSPVVDGPAAMIAPEGTEAPTRQMTDEEPVLPSPGVRGPSDPGAAIGAGADAVPDPAQPLGLPPTGFESGVPGVRTDRLPTASVQPPPMEEAAAPEQAPAASAPPPAVAPAAEGAAPPPAPPTDAAAPATATEPEAGALARNARAVELRAGVPLMSVILIDAGEEGVARAALHELSVPVTFAVDPTLSDAGDIVRGYRDAGHEVVTLARGLPPGATPSDLEETMTALLAATDGSVAVLDAATGGFQDDRALSAQMVSLAGASGHGLLTYDRGLNGAARMAGQVGVPAATVFRLLDGARDNPFVIRRKLNRALFKARQDGHVIVVGHSYRDTVSAFYEWALEAAADEVQLVPVSAILTRE